MREHPGQQLAGMLSLSAGFELIGRYEDFPRPGFTLSRGFGFWRACETLTQREIGHTVAALVAVGVLRTRDTHSHSVS